MVFNLLEKKLVLRSSEVEGQAALSETTRATDAMKVCLTVHLALSIQRETPIDDKVNLSVKE